MPLVHAIEAVDVDHQQADGAVVRGGALDLALEGLVKGDPVRQASQRIGPGGVCKPGEQTFHPCAQIGEQGCRGDQRAGGDHEMVDRQVVAVATCSVSNSFQRK